MRGRAATLPATRVGAYLPYVPPETSTLGEPFMMWRILNTSSSDFSSACSSASAARHLSM